jgi:hypothetical protein
LQANAFPGGEFSIGFGAPLGHLKLGLLVLKTRQLRAGQLTASDAVFDTFALNALALINGPSIGLGCCNRWQNCCAHRSSGKKTENHSFHRCSFQINSMCARCLHRPAPVKKD